DGASVSLNNAVSGSTTGSLNLYQNAYAGNGGGAGSFGLAGNAGSASSTLSVFDISAPVPSWAPPLQPEASGGFDHFGSAPGGAATATTVLTGVGSVQGQSSATGGAESACGECLGNGGAGGTATASTTVTGGAGNANASSTAHGGAGGAL